MKLLLPLLLFLVACGQSSESPSSPVEPARPAPALPPPATFADCPAFQKMKAKKPRAGKPRVMMVVFENADFDDVYRQPFFRKLADQGTLFTNFRAITHPSQPNYFALTAGDTFGVGNETVTIDARHLGNLLEEAGKSWKVYAEGYSGSCALDEKIGYYVRRHNPFMSYRNVIENPARCSRVVSHCQLLQDVYEEKLPDFALYVPDLFNDGHETGPAAADRWLAQEFGPLLEKGALPKNLLFVATFDEDSGRTGANRIYTAFFGGRVPAGKTDSHPFNHYSLLRTIEKYLGTGTLNRGDQLAKVLPISRHSRK